MPENSELLIKLENVDICQEQNIILKNINWNVKVGEFNYIIGKVGSGKSSLLKTLYAELPIKEGSIEVAGIKLNKIKNRQIPKLRRKIGMIFQDLQLLNDRSVYDNLKFVLKATGWENKKDINIRIEQVLSNVGMLDKINNLPTRLSGGEQQSVCIARSILNNPPLIFADEPTGNLDPDSAEEIVKTLQKLRNEGKTIIMVTHNYNLLKKFPAKNFMCENQRFFEVKNEDIVIE